MGAIEKNFFFRNLLMRNAIAFVSRPTFKTATPTSRTQLKQQLQREQLQELERQEIERRENERKISVQVNGLNVDHSQFAHSSHSNPQQTHMQPRGCTNVSHMYTSSPTPSTSTDGSDFNSGQFSNQSNPTQSQTDLPNAPLKVPLHIGVDLPPQVLKVKFRYNYRKYSFSSSLITNPF